MKLPSTIIIFTLMLSGCGITLSDELNEFYPRVNTSLGEIEGYYKTSSNGRRYEAYEGIPYAEPPNGESRFRVAKNISSWNGVLMAKQFRSECMQYVGQQLKGSEDCLHLNIYTRIANRSQINLLPVIFFIHGGAFQTGTGIKYGSKYLLDKNVTLVTFNYRLGPLGFLSTEDEVVPGNMGLKDQVIALRWVKDNIQSFGGDPSSITIFGQSAGGSSVHYHYLTNLTAGLFQRGISLSGTALNCWAQTENSLEKAKKLATIVKCPSDNIQNMVNCLRDRPAREIVEANNSFMTWLGVSVTFGPVVEKVTNSFTFIDRQPIEIITSGDAQDLPWITGVTSGEGLIIVGSVVANDELLDKLNREWETIAPNLLEFNYTIDMSEHPTVARLMREDYLGTNPISRSTVEQTIRMVSDRMFVYDTVKAAKLQARLYRSPVRFYYLSYRGVHSQTKMLSGSDEDYGVCHGDDLSYYFDVRFDTTTTPDDRDVQRTLVNLGVSFATEGTPDVGVNWLEMKGSTEESYYLDIAGPEKNGVKELKSLNFGENKSWHNIEFHENMFIDGSKENLNFNEI